jgi:hypothetical protein
MFEEEIELGKKVRSCPSFADNGAHSGVCWSGCILLKESRQVLTPSEASTVVTNIPRARGSTRVSFHTGLIKERYEESPDDVRYRFLEKAGVINTGNSKPKRHRSPSPRRGRSL